MNAKLRHAFDLWDENKQMAKNDLFSNNQLERGFI
jgi:hypothetical protein